MAEIVCSSIEAERQQWVNQCVASNKGKPNKFLPRGEKFWRTECQQRASGQFDGRMSACAANQNAFAAGLGADTPAIKQTKSIAIVAFAAMGIILAYLLFKRK